MCDEGLRAAADCLESLVILRGEACGQRDAEPLAPGYDDIEEIFGKHHIVHVEGAVEKRGNLSRLRLESAAR